MPKYGLQFDSGHWLHVAVGMAGKTAPLLFDSGPIAEAAASLIRLSLPPLNEGFGVCNYPDDESDTGAARSGSADHGR